MMRVHLSYRNFLLNGNREIRMKLEGNERLGDNNVQEKPNFFERPLLIRPGSLLLALISVLLPISNNTEALAVVYSLYTSKVWGLSGLFSQVSWRIQEKIDKKPKVSALVRSTIPLPTAYFTLCLSHRARILK